MKRTLKRTIAKFNDHSLTPKVYHQGQIVNVDSYSVQLLKNKETIQYHFCQDRYTNMYNFFKEMQNDTKYAGGCDLDHFALFVKDDIIYVIHSKYYGIKSDRVKKLWYGFTVNN